MRASSDLVLAAGAVCWRVTPKGKVKVLLVHRTQHRDVSLPKGKLDPGETLPETAVREIAEETGLVIGLGAPLGVVEYDLPNGRHKAVYYWAAEVDEQAQANSTFVSNDEIESLRWVTVAKAKQLLSYPHDTDILDRFDQLVQQDRARTFPIIALRHAKATAHGEWTGPDATRPLVARGEQQAASVAPGVAAYRPSALISSTAVRCVSTIAPIARITGLPVDQPDGISQDAFGIGDDDVDAVVAKRLRRGTGTVLCSHGPVLPAILAAVGSLTDTTDTAALRQASALGLAEYAVVHVPRNGGGIVAVEVHGPTL